MAEPIFEPKAFNDIHGPLEVDTFRLDEQQLLTHAEQATTIRR